MVNFGLKLQAHMVRGWEQYFVDYEALKRLVEGPVERAGKAWDAEHKPRRRSSIFAPLIGGKEAERGAPGVTHRGRKGTKPSTGSGEGRWLLELASELEGDEEPVDGEKASMAFLTLLDSEVATANGFYLRKVQELVSKLQALEMQAWEANLLSERHEVLLQRASGDVAHAKDEEEASDLQRGGAGHVLRAVTLSWGVSPESGVGAIEEDGGATTDTSGAGEPATRGASSGVLGGPPDIFSSSASGYKLVRTMSGLSAAGAGARGNGSARDAALASSPASTRSGHRRVAAASLASLKTAFADLYRDLQLLQNFKVVNCSAVIKICKKHDKHCPTPWKLRSTVQKALQDLALASSSVADDALEVIEVLYADAFAEGSATVAKAELNTKRSFRDGIEWRDFEGGILVGVLAVFGVWVLFDCLVDVPRQSDAVAQRMLEAAWPAYRAIGCFVALLWLWGVLLFVWGRARVNYTFILDSDPRTAMDYVAVWREASKLTIALFASFLLFWKALRGDLGDGHRGALPAPWYIVFLLAACVYVAVFPLDARAGLWKALGNVLIAPFGRVTFRDGLLGDVLTSLIKPLVDVSYVGCLVATGQFLHIGLPAPDGPEGSKVCTDYAAWQQGVVPFIHALPLWLRFWQNIRRYLDTSDRFPHLANAFKYAFAMLVSLFGLFHPSAQSDVTETQSVLWLIFFTLSTLYTYWWDVTQDWGLGRRDAGGLRKDRMYAWGSCYYWSAIAADLVLRFLWTISIIPINSLPDGMAENFGFAVLPFLAIAELCRRTMWATIRMENEHLSHTRSGGFGRVDIIPLRFDTAGVSAGAAAKAAAETNKRRRRAALLEAGLFAAIFVGLSILAIVTKE